MGFGGVYSYGSATLFTTSFACLGAENVAATHGFVGYDRVTDEHIVRWNPDWIVAGADRGTVDEVRARLLAHPAIAATTAAARGPDCRARESRLPSAVAVHGALVEALADALYGAAS